jgi:hypothetical protein
MTAIEHGHDPTIKTTRTWLPDTSMGACTALAVRQRVADIVLKGDSACLLLREQALDSLGHKAIALLLLSLRAMSK